MKSFKKHDVSIMLFCNEFVFNTYSTAQLFHGNSPFGSRTDISMEGWNKRKFERSYLRSIEWICVGTFYLIGYEGTKYKFLSSWTSIFPCNASRMSCVVYHTYCWKFRFSIDFQVRKIDVIQLLRYISNNYRPI